MRLSFSVWAVCAGTSLIACGGGSSHRNVPPAESDASVDAGSGGAPGSGGKGGGGAPGAGGAIANGGASPKDAGAGGVPEAGTDAGPVCPDGVDLQTDPEHCGECTRNCAAAGATCAGGYCSAVTLDPSAPALFSTIGNGALYTLKTSAIPVSSYTIERIALDGTDHHQFYAAATGMGDSTFYADDTYLYWADSDTPPKVFRKAGTAASAAAPEVVFQPVDRPRRFTASGGTFYWVGGMYNVPAYVYSRPMVVAPDAGNDPGVQIVTTDQHYVSAFAVTSDAIYWVARNTGAAQLLTVPLAGGTPVPVPGATVKDNAPMQAVGKKLYFASSSGNASPTNGIYVYETGDAQATELFPNDSINTLVVDDTSLFYRAGYVDNTLWKVPLAGGTATPVVKTIELGGVAGQDETYIYTAHDWGSDGPALKIVK
ncbi:MAG TPA: hypothetical protein VHE30_21420 [Polyangiaceae bacterium]|nr:hypothetical protein [Polyangiaceae bacterium]